jgi:hypothetical protein
MHSASHLILKIDYKLKLMVLMARLMKSSLCLVIIICTSIIATHNALAMQGQITISIDQQQTYLKQIADLEKEIVDLKKNREELLLRMAAKLQEHKTRTVELNLDHTGTIALYQLKLVRRDKKIEKLNQFITNIVREHGRLDESVEPLKNEIQNLKAALISQKEPSFLLVVTALSLYLLLIYSLCKSFAPQSGNI